MAPSIATPLPCAIVPELPRVVSKAKKRSIRKINNAIRRSAECCSALQHDFPFLQAKSYTYDGASHRDDDPTRFLLHQVIARIDSLESRLFPANAQVLRSDAPVYLPLAMTAVPAAELDLQCKAVLRIQREWRCARDHMKAKANSEANSEAAVHSEVSHIDLQIRNWMPATANIFASGSPLHDELRCEAAAYIQSSFRAMLKRESETRSILENGSLVSLAYEHEEMGRIHCIGSVWHITDVENLVEGITFKELCYLEVDPSSCTHAVPDAAWCILDRLQGNLRVELTDVRYKVIGKTSRCPGAYTNKAPAKLCKVAESILKDEVCPDDPGNLRHVLRRKFSKVHDRLHVVAIGLLMRSGALQSDSFLGLVLAACQVIESCLVPDSK